MKINEEEGKGKEGRGEEGEEDEEVESRFDTRRTVEVA
jgi:hypothetical protein